MMMMVVVMMVVVVMVVVVVVLIEVIQASVGTEEADGGGGYGEHNVPLWPHILLQWWCLYVQVEKLLIIEIRIFLKIQFLANRNHRNFHFQAI